MENKDKMPDVPRVVFYGASGYSNSIVRSHGFPRPLCQPVAYIDDFRGGCGQCLNDIPIISFNEWKHTFSDLACFVTIADPKSRRRLADKILVAGGTFARLHERPEFSFPGVSIDAGTIVFKQTFIGPDTMIGKHVQVMPMCSIGHDVTISDYVTLCPSCTVSGYVVIEEEVFVGAGATIVNGKLGKPLIVGAGTKISAGAVVTKSIPPNTSVAGNPARPLRELARARRANRRNSEHPNP
jgi:sugar O-acyltransferase (sialic acid O-acetyltransferase NeuD family)